MLLYATDVLLLGFYHFVLAVTGEQGEGRRHIKVLEDPSLQKEGIKQMLSWGI